MYLFTLASPRAREYAADVVLHMRAPAAPVRRDLTRADCNDERDASQEKGEGDLNQDEAGKTGGTREQHDRAREQHPCPEHIRERSQRDDW